MMKNKTRFKLFQLFTVFGSILCVLKHTYFCIIYGWHWEAVEPDEKLVDGAMWIMWIIAAWFFLLVLYDIAKLFASANIRSININYEKQSNDAGSILKDRKITEEEQRVIDALKNPNPAGSKT